MLTPSINSINSISQVLECKLCSKRATNAHICPNCSRFFCEICIKNWLRTKEHKCPNCTFYLQPNSLINCQRLSIELSQALDQLEVEYSNKNTLLCSAHQLKKLYFCITCQLPLCSDCSVLSGIHHGHQFEKLSTLKANYDQSMRTLNQKMIDKKKVAQKMKDILLESQMQLAIIKENKFGCLEKYVRNFQERISKKMNGFVDQFEKIKNNESLQLFQFNNLHLNMLKNLKQCSKAKLVSKLGRQMQIELTKNMRPSFMQNQQRLIKSSEDEIRSQLIPQYKVKKFLLDNYTRTRQKLDYFYSQIFYSDGLQWRLKIYPNGISEENQSSQKIPQLKTRKSVYENSNNQQYLSIFIELTKGLQQIGRYKHKVQITNHLKSNTKISRQFQSDFESGQCWGYDTFAKISLLYQQGYVHPTQDYVEIVLHVGPPSYYHACLDQNSIIKRKLEIIQQNEKHLAKLKQIHQLPQILETAKPHQLMEKSVEQVITPKCIVKKTFKDQEEESKANYKKFIAWVNAKEVQSEEQCQINADLVKTYVKTQIYARAT